MPLDPFLSKDGIKLIKSIVMDYGVWWLVEIISMCDQNQYWQRNSWVIDSWKKKNRKKEQQKKNAFNEVNAQFLMQECHNAGKLIKSTDAIIIIPIKSKKFITDGNMTPLNK